MKLRPVNNQATHWAEIMRLRAKKKLGFEIVGGDDLWMN